MPQIKDEETRSQFRCKLDDVSGKVFWECKHCKGTRTHENITKMRQHLIKCTPYQAWKVREPSVDVDVAHEIGIDLTGDEEPVAASASNNNSEMELNAAATNGLLAGATSTLKPTSNSSSGPPKANANLSKLQTQSTIGFLNSTTPAEKQQLDRMLARAIYSKFVPFDFIHNPHFVEFVRMLRNTYTLPTMHELRGKHLDQLFSNAQMRTEDAIKAAKHVTLVCDGWSNVRRDAIVGFVVCTPSPAFLYSVDTGTEKHDGEYIAKLMGDAIEKIGPAKVLFVVTDNASAMKKAWRILETRFKHVTALGCAAHGVNLLFLDFLKLHSFKRFREEVKNVARVFRRQQVSQLDEMLYYIGRKLVRFSNLPCVDCEGTST